ncbi:exonuclease SbcCD subunit D [Anaerofustis sp. NSJ-163]|uniref:exonuclease SbcCD subunit D n=1 Tax=Anaerofustis sp. NSJ-163 TaxID=2944391 RepID=UPI00209C0FBF|nr:exonuclease SbcCD subunit D [Anaerofustis sp. NSJ-163]MCO8194768.1 exonuclease SbcCD subunit D [Anaerofustis sp. NSJ-163]
MKFMHLSDLHLGKKVNGYSMIEDQKYIINNILEIIDNENIESVIIAGDVYDKSVPPVDAVELFNDFLEELENRNLYVFVISGNHDSPERIAFGNSFMRKSKIYFSPVYNGEISEIELNDEYGKINVWMLPFIKPLNVRKVYEDKVINTYNDAVKTVIDNLKIDTNERNIMITHQFVTGAERTDSEEISVGGSDNIDVSNFDKFDYTALGHIHRPQNCKSERVRYSGTPLKYSFSEAKDKKSATIIDIKEKNNISIKIVPFKPLRDMVEIKGKYNDIMRLNFYKDTSYREDYMHIILTDEEDIPDVITKLRAVYHNIMKVDYDNMRTRTSNKIKEIENIESFSPFELFSDFYKQQNNQSMNEEQNNYIKNTIEEIWGND